MINEAEMRIVHHKVRIRITVNHIRQNIYQTSECKLPKSQSIRSELLMIYIYNSDSILDSFLKAGALLSASQLVKSFYLFSIQKDYSQFPK
jgi:hypothetical protein